MAEEIEMQDYSFNDDVFDEEETPLLDGRSLQQELGLSAKVDDFYESIGETPFQKDYNNFYLNKDGFFIHTDEGPVRLNHGKSSDKFLAKTTLQRKMGGINEMRKKLNLQTMDTRSLSKESFQQFQEFQSRLPNVERMPMRDLPSITENIRSSIETVAEDLPRRELLALDTTLQTIRGELTNNLAKLGELDKHIEREKNKIVEADDANVDTEVKQRIESRLRDLNEERSVRLEVLNNNREQLRTQVNRIRETINRILHEDTTLAERIKTLFREQGITIVSILTAFSFVISTIVLAVTGTSPPSPPSPSSNSNSDLKSWVKKQLKHLSELIKKLAIKAVDSLPAIIGSIVSWIFSTAGKVVGYMADHLWTLLILLAGILISKIKK